MTNSVTLSGQDALESWEIQREQEVCLREAMLADEALEPEPQRTHLRLPVLAGAGGLVLAATVLGIGALI
ncbi:hypothetical protein [Sagittula sp. SSi028]|uniref:hypothetical protein n=1 Tax=Sagittula sp. SSi028 TaxID=3400636 RepID=UPI003AF99C6C